MGREEVLLKEYETCQAHNNSIESQVWTSTTIFMGLNVTLAGGLMFAILNGTFNANIDKRPWLFALYLLLFFGIIAILVLWKKWLERTRQQRALNNWRMQRIEEELGMWKNRMVSILDNNANSSTVAPAEVKLDVEEIRQRFGKTLPGAYCLICIVDISVALWAIVFVASLASMFSE